MVALSFAFVPLYSLFCSVTGFGGTTQRTKSAPSEILERTITVKFNADTGRQLNWHFAPEQRQVKTRLGQKALIAYTALNKEENPVAGTALFNVTPSKAGKYFHKIQCFCFDEQILQPGEKVSMPVLFYVDPALDEDPNMDDVSNITLSYSFFKTESPELEQALEAFYNEPAISSENASFTE